MKFSRYVLLALEILFFVNLIAMDENENQIILPSEVWKNIQKYLLHCEDREALAHLFVTNRAFAHNMRDVLGEKSASTVHWQLLGKNIIPKKFDNIANGQMSNDGSFIVYGIDSFFINNKDVILFNIEENFEKRLFSGLSTINGTTYWAHWILSNNNAFIVYEQNGNFYLYTLATNVVSNICTSNGKTIKHLKISADDTKIIIGYSDNEIKIHDLTTNDCVIIPAPPVGSLVTQILLSSDNNFLVTTVDDNTTHVTNINVQDLRTMDSFNALTHIMDYQRWFYSSGIADLFIDATSQFIIMRTSQNNIVMYDIINRAIIPQINNSGIIATPQAFYTCGNYNDRMISMTFNIDHNNYEMGVSARVNGHVTEIARCQYRCPSEVYGKLVKLSKNNCFAVIALSNGTIKVFDLKSGKHITLVNPYLRFYEIKSTFNGFMSNGTSYTPKALFISDNNAKITVITQSGTIIWDITDCLQALKNHTPVSLSLFKKTPSCVIIPSCVIV